MSASIGATIGAMLRKDWLLAAFYVATCAINHVCYNFWSRALKNESR